MIRNYNKDDIDNIEKLGNELHSNYKFNLDTFSKCLVFEDEKIIGFITYSIIYDRAEIIDIIVSKEERNKGLGKRLLLEAINDCKTNNCKNITLEVRKSNKIAIDFYKKNGFNIISMRKKYYKEEDGYLMGLEVK